MSSQEKLNELEQAFRHLVRKVKASWNRFDLYDGVSASQASILERLDSDGPLKVSQLAEHLWVTAGAVTSLSDKLITGGFAERTRSEEDRRVVILTITDKGREVVKASRAFRQSVIQSYFGKLQDEDVNHLIRIFNELTEDPDPKS